MSNLPGVVLKPPEDVSGSTVPPCITGCMYQVIQTIGLDGKNLLKLLPLPNSSGNIKPLVTSSVTSDTSNGNITNPVHVARQTPRSSAPTTTASSQFPVFSTVNSTNSGNYFISKAVDKSENVRMASVGKESLASAPSAQSSATKVDTPALPKVAVPPPTTQGDTTYMLVNTKNLPVTVKSPVLPYGHHLQIPANAEVKSVPASFLPAPIQQKILAAAAVNTSTTDASKVPTVIYVSPVNTVKSVLPRPFKNICPKPPDPTDASKPLMPNTSQSQVKTPATDVSNKEDPQSQDTPMKWVVRENPLTSPCLVPVKSSNNMASKILKTLMDMKTIEPSALNVPSLSTVTSAAQIKLNPIKDNALVMFNGKVYLLAKKGSEVLPYSTDYQTPAAPDTSPRKDTPPISSPSSVTKITNEVVNIVLAKNKPAPPKEPKPLSDTQHASEPSSNLEKTTSRAEGTSAQSTENAKQPVSYLEQHQTVHIKLNLPDVIKPVQNAKKETSVSSAKEDTALTSKHCFSTDQEPKNKDEMAPLKTHTQSTSKKDLSQRECNELRKKFGITKDPKVRLTRIPVCDSTKSSYFPSSVKSSISSKESEVIVDLTSGKDEDLEELTLQQVWDKKRKSRSNMKVYSAKKRKPWNDVSTSVNVGTNTTAFQNLNSISPASAVPPCTYELIDCTKSSEENSPAIEISSQDSFDRGTDSPVSPPVEQEPPDCYIDDSSSSTLPEFDETIRDEKIKRLKLLLKEREAALEEIRKKMHQS